MKISNINCKYKCIEYKYKSYNINKHYVTQTLLLVDHGRDSITIDNN